MDLYKKHVTPKNYKPCLTSSPTDWGNSTRLEDGVGDDVKEGEDVMQHGVKVHQRLNEKVVDNNKNNSTNNKSDNKITFNNKNSISTNHRKSAVLSKRPPCQPVETVSCFMLTSSPSLIFTIINCHF